MLIIIMLIIIIIAGMQFSHIRLGLLVSRVVLVCSVLLHPQLKVYATAHLSVQQRRVPNLPRQFVQQRQSVTVEPYNHSAALDVQRQCLSQ